MFTGRAELTPEFRTGAAARSGTTNGYQLMFKWLDRIACWMFGHVFPVTWVSPGGAAHDWGTCQRCGRFQIADYEADQCRDCGNTIAAGDDDALICVQCGGRNRRATVG